MILFASRMKVARICMFTILLDFTFLEMQYLRQSCFISSLKNNSPSLPWTVLIVKVPHFEIRTWFCYPAVHAWGAQGITTRLYFTTIVETKTQLNYSDYLYKLLCCGHCANRRKLENLILFTENYGDPKDTVESFSTTRLQAWKWITLIKIQKHHFVTKTMYFDLWRE